MESEDILHCHVLIHSFSPVNTGCGVEIYRYCQLKGLGTY